jgi:hypothetical protein
MQSAATPKKVQAPLAFLLTRRLGAGAGGSTVGSSAVSSGSGAAAFRLLRLRGTGRRLGCCSSSGVSSFSLAALLVLLISWM